MRLKNALSLRAASLFGMCALLLCPLAGRAQTAPDVKPTEPKPAEVAATGETYTLRIKFKQDDVNRYKTQVKTSVKTPAGLNGETKTTASKTDAITEQKTNKLLDGGAAEIVTTVKNAKTETDGKPSDAPAIPPVTAQISPAGKVLSVKTDEENSDFLKKLLASSFSTPQSFLPDAPVKVGDKWTQKFALSGPAKDALNGTMDCALTRIETVNGIKTALIHAIMKVPVTLYLDASGQMSAGEADAMAVLDGSLVSNLDIQFAIDAGRIAQTVSSGALDIDIKIGKGAPPEAASFLPKGAKITGKMDSTLRLLAPGEKIEEAPVKDAKPETPDKK